MNEKLKKIIEFLKSNKKTISFMESCTGGYLASQLTNIEGASNVFKGSIVTYSNEFKITFGVSKDIINTYSVYSSNTAEEMAKRICDFTKADWGIGVTGQIAEESCNTIYYSIFDSNKKANYNYTLIVPEFDRETKKSRIARDIFNNLEALLCVMKTKN